MFRVLFFILILSFTLYGIWWLYAPFKSLDEQEINKQYEAYLSWAIARNSWDFKRYDVIFYTKDFSENIESTTWKDNWNQTNSVDFNLDTNSLQEENRRLNSRQGNIWTLKVDSEAEEIASKKWNFWTPGVTKIPSVSLTDSLCAGIFYDPCITLNIPDSWELGAMYLGITPIYDDPNQRG